ncbi:MAG TPA: radical SAM protein [Candidatus Limnocylindria bacterium]|nr:radical SAM protein [Candidatus Limnocylindria bacterium]
MRRPVWLLSMDTDQFCAPPMTTGALKSYFVRYGRTAAESRLDLVHFANRAAVEAWLADAWPHAIRPEAKAALAAGLVPVLAVSCYTWNVAEFLEVVRRAKADVPGLLVIAGGPHVQRAQDFLYGDGIDVVVLGEGEITFTELLDCASREQWPNVAGLAFLDAAGRVHTTPPRPRATDLDRFPSALDVIELRDADGKPRYQRAAYETSRGCPYRCSFCEWGTGAIGTKMYQFSLPRIRHDLERLIEGGVHDIWFSDSNFGALREDLEKAQIVVDLRRRTGRPHTFATSWSKNHNTRVQEIVRLLHRHGLLWHYHLALQTLTPLALELSHRTNMRANDYEPVVKALAAEGVPVTAELIWGLPGDDLASFARNLDHLYAVFPNINIFAYTLLPGTEFFDKREEYRLETLPVAGYGKAKGEYVVGCHTFSRADGEEGYVLVGSHVMFSRGHVFPHTLRLLALDGRTSVSALVRATARALMREFADQLPAAWLTDRMAVYENRAALYLTFLAQPERMWPVIRRTVERHLADAGASDLWPRAAQVLALDEVFCPRTGPTHETRAHFDFAADRVLAALGEMELPAADAFEPGAGIEFEIHHPAQVGEVLVDPDGGAWMRGRIRSMRRDGEAVGGLPAWFAEQGRIEAA